MSDVATPEPFEYTLTVADATRFNLEWRMRRYGGDVRPYYVAFVIVAAFGLIGLAVTLRHLHDHPNEMTARLTVACAAIIFCIALRALLRYPTSLRRTKKLQKTQRLTFVPSGIELITNGVFERVSWYAIGEAYDLPHAYGLSRRDDAMHPILVPKTALTGDGSALWSYLEYRLTGTHPSIRDLGFTAPHRLTNTVDQFLTDRALSA